MCRRGCCVLATNLSEGLLCLSQRSVREKTQRRLTRTTARRHAMAIHRRCSHHPLRHLTRITARRHSMAIHCHFSHHPLRHLTRITARRPLCVLPGRGVRPTPLALHAFQVSGTRAVFDFDLSQKYLYLGLCILLLLDALWVGLRMASNMLACRICRLGTTSFQSTFFLRPRLRIRTAVLLPSHAALSFSSAGWSRRERRPIRNRTPCCLALRAAQAHQAHEANLTRFIPATSDWPAGSMLCAGRGDTMSWISVLPRNWGVDAYTSLAPVARQAFW